MDRIAYLIAGLAFGDEGKGVTTHFLGQTRKASLVVRYNGGAQAAHNVVTDDDRWHTFAQFGSATLVGARTHLSRFMLINPENMDREAAHLQELGISDPYKLTTIDRDAVIITPFHIALNRDLERHRGSNAHGTCGQGIGVARSLQIRHGKRVLTAGDLSDFHLTCGKLSFIAAKCDEERERCGIPFQLPGDSVNTRLLAHYYQRWAGEAAQIVPGSHLGELLLQHDSVVFEGAQGVLLDETYGTAPHNTWTNTTFGNAFALLEESGWDGGVYRIGCLRTIFTRHGAGPFPTEDRTWYMPEPHNLNSGIQGRFRIGHFDSVLARKAIDIIGGVDEIALSHVDYLELMPYAFICTQHDGEGKPVYERMNKSGGDLWNLRYIRRLEELVGTPTGIIGVGPKTADRARLRRWSYPQSLKTVHSSMQLASTPA